MFLRGNLLRSGLAFEGAPYEAVWAAREAGGAITSVAAHGWNGIVLLQAPIGAGELTAEVLRMSGLGAAGLLGPRAQVEEARAVLVGRPPPPMDEVEDLLALDLEELRVPGPLATGAVRCRPAGAADLPLLTAWRRDYRVETLGPVAGPAMLAGAADEVHRLVEDRELFVLEAGGQLVACSAFNARLPDRVQIGGVWTPPALRGRGYARAVVAGSLLRARQEGVQRAILFTGTGNTGAQRAYRALGFHAVGEFAIVMW
jgi:RimJ/RimL family protein N-acetyltransferase